MSKAEQTQHPAGMPDPEPDEWVVESCRSPLQFWQQYQEQAEFPEPALLASKPGTEGEVLVIRGFDNLLHYLDWYDSVQAAAGKVPSRDKSYVG